MSETVVKLLEQVRALPPEEQDWLLEQLQSDEVSDLTDDPEFFAELQRRSDEAHAHPERLVDGPTALREARELLEKLRKSS